MNMNGSSSSIGSKRTFPDNISNDHDLVRVISRRNTDSADRVHSSNIMLGMMQPNYFLSAQMAPCPSVTGNCMIPFGCTPAFLMSQYMANPFFQAQWIASAGINSQLTNQLASSLPPSSIISSESAYQGSGNAPCYNPNMMANVSKGMGMDSDLVRLQFQQSNMVSPMMSFMDLPNPPPFANNMLVPQFGVLSTYTPLTNDDTVGIHPNEVEDDDSSKNDKINQRGRIRWTKHMDELLLEGFELFKDYKVGMWKKVAQYVSAHLTFKNPTPEDFENCQLIVTNHQCGERYKHHLHPDIQSKKSGPWSDEEIEQLKQLVADNQVVVDGVTSLGRSKTQVNWIRVSETLNRNYRDCQHKWTAVSKSSLKKGVFTKDEEDLIVQTVDQLGDIGTTWNLLEHQLGRKRRSIQDKYNYLRKRKKNVTLS